MYKRLRSIRTTNQSLSVSYSYFNLLKMHGTEFLRPRKRRRRLLSAQGARLVSFPLEEKERGERPRIATWLILPVVIRLSQRLSHACLSINLYTVKLRMAHYISYSLFDSPCYLDTRSNSRANTCVKAQTFVCAVFIRFEPTSSEFFGES